MNKRHPALVSSLLLLAAACAAGWALHKLWGQQAAAEDIARELAECQQLVRQISWLRDQPNLAGASEVQINELAALIEKAAGEAQVDRANLVRIWPNQARRVGDSPYLENPTQVLIRNASLEQVCRFLTLVEDSSFNLRATAIRLTVPHESDDEKLWTLETTVSYLVYSPTTQTNAISGTVD
ncbi:MAG: hypothetical protein IT445_06370 [Phycisphaeraceae bacterium]|nr:hypothetical protein [Phycisphaeraceae bacterium]